MPKCPQKFVAFYSENCEEEEEEGEEVGKGDNSAAKTPVSLLQVDKSSWQTRDNVY